MERTARNGKRRGRRNGAGGAAEGRRRRDKALDAVEAANPKFAHVARRIAERVAEDRGLVTSDDVRERCSIVPDNPNAWGGIFRGGKWKWTGEVVASRRPEAHARMIKVWRLR